jgi:hypothetical protein
LHLPGWRTLIDDLTRGVVPDENRSGTPAAGILRQVPADHHEVQGLQHLFRVPEVRVLRLLQDERERHAIPCDSKPVLVFGVDLRLLALHRGNRVLQGDVVPFDAVGALDGTSQSVAPEKPTPSTRLTRQVLEVCPELVDLGEDSDLDLIQVRSFEQHGIVTFSLAPSRIISNTKSDINPAIPPDLSGT